MFDGLFAEWLQNICYYLEHDSENEVSGFLRFAAFENDYELS
jgi:hypothetical protein